MKKLSGILKDFQILNHLWKKYRWKEINYPSKRDDCKILEKNDTTIALNILCIKEKETCPGFISKLIRIMKNKQFY